MSDRPRTSQEAMELALDWAEGKRSWTNLVGPHQPHTPDVVAVMDAQEVVKWTAIATALRETEDARKRESLNLTIGWLDSLAQSTDPKLHSAVKKAAAHYRDKLREALSGVAGEAREP